MPKRTVPHEPLFTPEEQDELARLIFKASLIDMAAHGTASRVLSLEIHGVAHPGVFALLVVQPMDEIGERLHRQLQATCEKAVCKACPDVEPTRAETQRWLG